MVSVSRLNGHINTAGVTPEQPVHQGDDLCPARDGTCGDWPLLPVHGQGVLAGLLGQAAAELHPFQLQGVKPWGTEPGLKPGRALFLSQGGPNSPHPGTVTSYTALFAPTRPCCCLCFSIPGLSNGVNSHCHRPCSVGCRGSRGQDPKTATGWAQRGSHSFPGDTLERERQAFGNSRDFVLNPVGLLVFEVINDFSHVAPAWQRKAAAPAPQAKPEPTLSQDPSTEGQSFCHQTPLASGGVWQLTEVMG